MVYIHGLFRVKHPTVVVVGGLTLSCRLSQRQVASRALMVGGASRTIRILIGI